jgi:hypothetical protein
MKKTTLAFAFAFTGMICIAQIPNNGFENWTSMGSYNDPDSWDNLNSVTNFAGVYTCTKGTPGNPGSSYIKLTSKTVTGMGVVPGMAGTGTLDPINVTASGFAYSSRPQSLTGAWQYMAGSTADKGFISVLLTQWNSSLGKRDTVAYTFYLLPGMVMSWANFTLPLTYKNGNNPDTASIILSSSGNTPVASSYLYIDNLAFAGSVAGISENATFKKLSYYPNPADNMVELDVDFEKGSSGKAQLFDVSGALVKEFALPAAGRHRLDVSSVPAGMYLMKVSAGTATETKKLIIE